MALGPERASAHFNLRVFGYHDQATNITLMGGVRMVKDTGAAEQQTQLGGKVSLCFTRFFGVEATWLSYLASDNGAVAAGSRTEAGAFIDYSILRVYGSYFSESSPFDRSGVSFGTRLYF